MDPRPAEPILLELDPATWKQFLDRSETWLGNVLMTQVAFRKLAEHTAPRIHEPHLRAYVTDIAQVAAQHVRDAEELFRVIGREPSEGRRLPGALLFAARRVMADLRGLGGGAVGGFRLLQEMLLANQDAIGAFATAEQLGLALGLPAIVDITFRVTNEKTKHQLLLQEIMLEMGATAILYKARA